MKSLLQNFLKHDVKYDKIYNVTNFRFCCLWKTFEGTVLQMMMEGEMIEHVMCMADEIGKIIFYKNYYNTIDKKRMLDNV